MFWLVLGRGTAEKEQFTCTEVRMAGTQMPLLTRAELAPGFSRHAYQSYHSKGLVATSWTLPVTCLMKITLVLPLSCAVLLHSRYEFHHASLEHRRLECSMEGSRDPTVGDNLGGAGTESRRHLCGQSLLVNGGPQGG